MYACYPQHCAQVIVDLILQGFLAVKDGSVLMNNSWAQNPKLKAYYKLTAHSTQFASKAERHGVRYINAMAVQDMYENVALTRPNEEGEVDE